jgi:hypothetical protein
MTIKDTSTQPNKRLSQQRVTCDTYYGIPVSPEDVTQNWVDYQQATLDDPTFWYITYDQSLEVVLGQPIEFEVTTPPMPL